MSARVLRSGRVYCLGCNRHQRMRADGTFQAHRVDVWDGWGHARSSLGQIWCMGSYRTPARTEVVAQQNLDPITGGDWKDFIGHPASVDLAKHWPAQRKKLREMRAKEPRS